VTLKIRCPICGVSFTIDHVAAERRIAALEADNQGLRARLTAAETMRVCSPLPSDAAFHSFFDGVEGAAHGHRS
jgi:hypothetical protein